MRFARALPALAYMALLFGLSSQPVWMPPGPPGNDKLVHFGAYLVLGVLCWYALEWPVSTVRRSVLAATIAAAYGAGDEIHQLYVPGRFGDVADFAADALGGAVGAALAAWRGRRT